MSFSSQLILVSILKELAKEKLQISYLIENVFLITVEVKELAKEKLQISTLMGMSFSSQLILVSILKVLAKEKLQISYLIEKVFLTTVDSGKYSEGIGQGETTDQLPHWECLSYHSWSW